MKKVRIEFNQWELRHIISALTEKISDLTQEITENERVHPEKEAIIEIAKLYRDNLNDIKDKLQQKL
jgi:hypothetical protein